jgi:malate dehydrogenase (oxaloacetate-decarboxylating)(NADP+)
MQVAAVKALAGLAKEQVPEEVLKAYGKDEMAFGAEYIIPTPLDPRLRDRIPQAIAQAAIDTGVAKK